MGPEGLSELFLLGRRHSVSSQQRLDEQRRPSEEPRLQLTRLVSLLLLGVAAVCSAAAADSAAYSGLRMRSRRELVANAYVTSKQAHRGLPSKGRCFINGVCIEFSFYFSAKCEQKKTK